jgi:hypothetical protein
MDDEKKVAAKPSTPSTPTQQLPHLKNPSRAIS